MGISSHRVLRKRHSECNEESLRLRTDSSAKPQNDERPRDSSTPSRRAGLPTSPACRTGRFLWSYEGQAGRNDEPVLASQAKPGPAPLEILG